ncbi:MAG: NAD(P)-binding domain-containing protein [Methanobacterium sp.]|uniref:pyrroline-5-carboxylate reductase family protein n=1 Tax=Methanobacterium sp. TaxID=2164 RepID=UPI00258B07E0|nr:NAD(P)-binding domain-containing protein [Methanobacterium sp.]MCC7559576.1 NAD(P)-binding domain-containing protein [Methanobacterium sp.]
MKSIGFIGGGRVTKILLNGFKKAGILLDNVVVYDISTDTLKELKKDFPEIKTVSDDNMLAASQDMVFLAVHPPAMASVLEEIKSYLNPDSVVISLAPKPKIEEISSLLGGFTRIVRMIPNAPSIINEGYNPITFAPEINVSLKKEILDLFNVLGVTPEVEENKLEAYAVLTAMGPTYFWFQFNELLQLGRSFGLADTEIKDSLWNMISGAAQTFYQSELNPEEVIDLVPVKPMADEEEKIKTAYQARLGAMFQQLRE